MTPSSIYAASLLPRKIHSQADLHPFPHEHQSIDDRLFTTIDASPETECTTSLAPPPSSHLDPHNCSLLRLTLLRPPSKIHSHQQAFPSMKRSPPSSSSAREVSKSHRPPRIFPSKAVPLFCMPVKAQKSHLHDCESMEGNACLSKQLPALLPTLG